MMAKNCLFGDESIADLGNISNRKAVKAERATKGGGVPSEHGNNV